MNMVDTDPTISTILECHAPLKDRDCHNGSKSITQLYVVYMKPTLSIKTHID